MNTPQTTVVILLTLLILGCSTKPITKEPAPQTKNTPPLTPESIINQAENSENQRHRSALYLKAATMYCNSGLFAECDASIKQASPSHLDNQERQNHLTLVNHICETIGNYQRLIQLIEQTPSTVIDNLPIDQQVQIYSNLGEAHLQNNQPLKAAILILDSIGLTSGEEQINALEKAWQILRQTDTVELNKYDYSGDNNYTLAWLELAKSISLNQIDLDHQYSAYQSWKQLWPEHPGAIHPPTELRLLNTLPSLKPGTITLALPLTGPIAEAGTAIRDGFIAAYFDAHNQNQNNPTMSSKDIEIKLFDTNSHDILTLYNTSTEDNIIIGPLDKESIKKLQELDEVITPTLALNKFDNRKKLSNIYQLSLAPESEAIQIAQHMIENDYRKTALLLPENNLGFRMHDSFIQEFSELNGLVIDTAFYNKQETLANTVAKLLGTEESKDRKRKIRSITGEKFVFFPRRRKDIDSIVMIAKPEIAKQLKPLFAFNYAADIPVFSSSHIHETSDTSKNRDLDNIQFLDIPWMLNEAITIKHDLKNSLSTNQIDYSRFHALGADAYKLIPRLKLLKQVRDSQLQGHSGLLTMDETGTIHRDLQWAKFKKGKAFTLRE